MMRAMGFAVGVGLSVATARPPLPSIPPACKLLNAQEASKLMGVPVVVNAGDLARADFNCRYNPGNAGPMSFGGVEITYRAFSDGPAAHAYFPRWVIPVPPKPADMTLTPVSGIGDEATVVHGKIANSVYFRRGAVLVKVGTVPGASDTALVTAGKTMAGRL
jgi:hypothetical protein